jgi:mycofactocin precursor
VEPTETAQGYDDEVGRQVDRGSDVEVGRQVDRGSDVEVGRQVDKESDDLLGRSVDRKREVEPAEDDAMADPLVELLVEEISIDGMCGVY